MKQLIFIISLLLISGCSVDKSTKTLENCADNIYSNKDREYLPSNFDLLIEDAEKWIAVTKLEERIILQKKAGFSRSEIVKWYVGLLKIKDVEKIKNKYSTIASHGESLETIKIAHKIAKEHDKTLKNFINKSINHKLQSSNYYRYFSACETIRKKTPKTFDAKWKKSKVIYNKDL